MAAVAEDQGFFSAQAKAFVSDGQAYSWTIQCRRFPSFEPILDFVHAPDHLHDTARAVGKSGKRWAEC